MKVKAVRLTNYMRDSIRVELLTRRFKDEREQLSKDWTKLGEDCYRDLYPPDVLRKMKALPGSFFPSVNDLTFKFGGDVKQLYWGEDGTTSRRVSFDHSEDVAKVYPATHPLTDRFRELNARKAKRKEQEQQLKAEINAILNSTSTVQALINKWPTVEPFARKYLQAAQKAAQLPVPVPEHLDKALDLPVTKDKPARPPAVKKVAKKKARRA